MSEIIPYYKPLGLTPLQAIHKLTTERPELKQFPITYAGRLDPMAEGLLLLLVGDAVHQKEELLHLPKTYDAHILLGFSSDTYDALGIPLHGSSTHFDMTKINEAVQQLLGTHHLPYPPYASQPVNGKPLWQWAREDKLQEIEIPVREMTVFDATVHKLEEITLAQIYNAITHNMSLVSGDFRQPEILAAWRNIVQQTDQAETYTLTNITFNVTSGTYIRALAQQLGKLLNTPALLYSLKRTSVGPYSI